MLGLLEENTANTQISLRLKMSTTKPESFIIAQVSSNLKQNSLVAVSTNSTTDVQPSYGIPDEANKGGLSLIGHGTPSTETKLDLRIQDSGTIDSFASYIWKDNSESDTEWKGDNDGRFISDCGAPFLGQYNTMTGLNGVTACFADFLMKEFIYTVENSELVRVAYRTITGVLDDQLDWEYTTINTLDFETNISAGDRAQIDVAITIHNTFVMAVKTNSDINIYHSTDGIEFTLVCKDVIKRFSDLPEDVARRINIQGLKIAVSGDYCRMVFVTGYGQQRVGTEDGTTELVPTEEYLDVFASSDLGLSWTKINKNQIIAFRAAGNAAEPYSHDISSINDADGSFMLCMGGQPVQTIVARGDDAPSGNYGTPFNTSYGIDTYVGFVLQDFHKIKENFIQLQFVRPTPQIFTYTPEYWAKNFTIKTGKVYLVKNDSFIYLIEAGYSAMSFPNQTYINANMPNPDVASNVAKSEAIFSHELRMWRMPLDGIITSDKWQSLNGKVRNSNDASCGYFGYEWEVGVTGFCRGAGRFFLSRAKFYFLGNAIACAANLIDTNSSLRAGRHAYFKLSGWSKFPIYDIFQSEYNIEVVPYYAGRHQGIGKLFDLQTNALFGLPQAGTFGLNDTPWNYQNTHQQCRVTLENDTSGNYPYMLFSSRASFMVEMSCMMRLFPYQGPFQIGSIYGGNIDNVGGSHIRLVAGKVGHDRSFQIILKSNTKVLNDNINIKIFINLGTVSVISETAGTEHVVIQPNTATYGSGMFGNAMWEFRIGFEADLPRISPTGNNNNPRGVFKIACRRLGKQMWENSDDLFPSGIPFDDKFGTTSISPSETQVEVFLKLQAPASYDTTARVKSFEFRKNCSLGMIDQDQTLAFKNKKSLRGRACNTVGQTLLQNQLKASFGGGSGATGDLYTLKTRFSYAESEAITSSGSKWRSVTTSIPSVLIFKSNKGQFIHDGWAMYGLNCKLVKIEYSETEDFSSTTTAVNRTLTTGVSGTVSAIKPNIIKATITNFKEFQDYKGYGFASTDKNNFYLRFTTLSASVTNIPLNASFKIIDHFDDTFLVESAENTVASGMVGSTVEIYSDRFAEKTSEILAPYLRVTLYGPTAEGYHTLGNFIAGRALDFKVPMDWAYTDSETANVQENRSRSGVKWFYPEGPPTRTISGRIIGDVKDFQRSKMRTLLRKSQYATTPLALIVADENTTDPNNNICARYVNEFVMDNAGWYYDSASESWYPVGDTAITFEEEP